MKSKVGNKVRRRKKKAWEMVRMGIFMLRKGLLMKKSDLHLLFKKGKMAVGKNLKNTLPFHNKSNNMQLQQRHYYEFSCSSSPSLSLDLKKKNQQGVLVPLNYYFSNCIHPRLEDGDESVSIGSASSKFLSDAWDDISIRSGSQKDDLVVEESGSFSSIDNKAEEFIANFYRQMNFQRQISQIQYEEMLARGAS